MTEKTQDILIKFGIGAIAYFVFAKPILNFLGITKSSTQREANNLQSSIESPFNPSYWKKYVKGMTAEQKKKAAATSMGIYNAMGYFTDNEDEVLAAIKFLNSKVEVSMMAFMFSQMWGKDLLEYLRKGKDLLPENGLNDTELGEVINLVARLPIK